MTAANVGRGRIKQHGPNSQALGLARWGTVGMMAGCFALLLPAEVMLRLVAGR